MAKPVVLTASAIPDAGGGPRIDVVELSKILDGRVIAPAPRAGLLGVVNKRTHIDIDHIARARREKASGYFAFSENLGIPLRLATRRAPQVTVVHRLDDRVKQLAARAAGLGGSGSILATFSQEQCTIITQQLSWSSNYVPYTVDEQFWKRTPSDETADYVLVVGREQRDWNTLQEAMRDLPIRCIAVAGSPWSHRPGPATQTQGNIEFRSRLTVEQLRSLYAQATIVVVPLHGQLTYAAGLTTLREAMATGRPVICTESPGLRGEIQDGVTGLTVPAGQSGLLANSIGALLADPQRAESLGRAAREWVVAERSFDRYMADLSSLLLTRM